jgi:hypothetical protein
MRFIVYFKSDEREKNAPLMTDLEKKIRSKVDEIFRVERLEIALKYGDVKSFGYF